MHAPALVVIYLLPLLEEAGPPLPDARGEPVLLDGPSHLGRDQTVVTVNEMSVNV